MFLSTHAGYWLPAVRCSRADGLPRSTLPSGSQFTGCNLVEKMWSLLVFGTDRLFFVRFRRTGGMPQCGEETGQVTMGTGERDFSGARDWTPSFTQRRSEHTV